MTSTGDERLLPAGVEVPFAEMSKALDRLGTGKRKATARAQTATLVVIGAGPRLREAAVALERLTASAGVRAILISEGTNPSPPARVFEHVVALEGLRTEYLNNAVGTLRLSSLPTLVWWRGDSPDSLQGLAALADRLVLDVDDPTAVWPAVAGLLERTAVSDLRWTRLTRWRALMAHFFDIPEVRAVAGRFDRLEIAAGDVHAGRLFAGWLASCLDWQGRVAIDIEHVAGGSPIERVRLGGGAQQVTLEMAPSRECVETTARVEGHAGATRIVPLGDQSLAALIAEELRVRSRDIAFEQALAALPGVA